MMDRRVTMTPDQLDWLLSEARQGRLYTDMGASDAVQMELDNIAAEANART